MEIDWKKPNPYLVEAIRHTFPEANLSSFFKYDTYQAFDFMIDCAEVYALKGPNLTMLHLLSDGDLNSTLRICSARNIMNHVMFWIALCLGVPGNALALATILRMTRSTGTFYVALLSASDLITIILKSLMHVLQYYNADNDVTCKVNHFLTNFFGTYANWVLVLICFERFVTIRFPLKKSYYFTMRRAHLSAVLLGLVLLPLFTFYLFHVRYAAQSLRCVDTNSGVLPILITVTTVIYSYLPMILMGSMVFAIAREIKKIQDNRKSIFGGGSARSGQAQSHLATQQKLKEQAKVERSITAMLFVASIVFVILTVPVCIIIPISYFRKDMWIVEQARTTFAYDVATNLLLLTHTVNFFIYFVSAVARSPNKSKWTLVFNVFA